MVSNGHITSFTEKALLNGTLLDWICPTNCEKNKISQTGDSVLQALRESPKDIFANEIKGGYYHWITKPVKAAARVVVIGTVTLTASPLGMVYNGGALLGHLLHYSFKKYVQGETAQSEKWDKITQYGKSCFTDSCSFFSGAVAVATLTSSFFAIYLGSSSLLFGSAIYSVAESIQFLVMGAVNFGIGTHFLGAYYPSEYIARLLVLSESRTGMYLSLELRNQLGLVGEDGNLLKFSKEDEIEFKSRSSSMTQTYHFHGKTVETLKDLIIEAELELIDSVKEANQWLKINDHPLIPYTYPFNGTKIANDLEKLIQDKDNKNNLKLSGTGPNINPNKKILKVIQNLKKIDYKINVFGEFFVHHKAWQLKDQSPLKFYRISPVDVKESQ